MKQNLMRHKPGIPDQDEACEHDNRLCGDRNRPDDLVEVRRHLDAADVEPDQDHDPGHRLYQPEPGQMDRSQGHGEIRDVVAERDPWKEVVEVADRKSTRLNSSHSQISYAVFCLKKNT